MRRLLLGFIVVLCLPLHTIAQESVGFSDPDNIQPLLDYRLPEWGYSNFYLDFSMNGNLNNNQRSDLGKSSTDNQYMFQLNPVYFRYKESEFRESSYYVSSLFDYSLDKSSSYSNEEEKNSDFELHADLNLNEQIYLRDSDMFLTGGLQSSFFQIKTDNEETIPSMTILDASTLRRNFTTNISIGFGFGRMRNVNPMIRSLRFNERLNALDTNQSMNDQDRFAAAEQFTRFNGYQQRYDRPEKYFWDDMDQAISPDLMSLTPFDLFYLTDTMNETIGSRREGWEMSAEVDLQYGVDYSKNENSSMTNNTTSRNTILIPSISGVWAKNLSLNQQITINGGFQYFKDLNSQGSFNMNKILNASGSWLYSISDRFLMTTNIGHFRIYRDLYTTSITNIGVNADYFIENSFSLFANLQFVYRPDSTVLTVNEMIEYTTDSKDFIFSAGLRYYFKRELF